MATSRMGNKGMHKMDLLVFVGIMALWIVLQWWLLPSLGVPT